MGRQGVAAIVAITVLAAFLSPGDTLVVTFLLMMPLILLYEFGIVLSAGVVRRRSRGGTDYGESPEDGASILGALALATYSMRASNKRSPVSA